MEWSRVSREGKCGGRGYIVCESGKWECAAAGRRSLELQRAASGVLDTVLTTCMCVHTAIPHTSSCLHTRTLHVLMTLGLQLLQQHLLAQ